MHIRITTEKGRKIRLRLPSRLFLGRTAAAIAAMALRKKQIELPRSVLANGFRTILAYRDQHPDWVLIDAHTADGTDIYIKL